jgi:hypothetical protein
MSIYLATVTDDNYVIVTIDGVEVDRPGPWNTLDGALMWAEAIILSLESGEIHYKEHQTVETTEI